MSIKTTHLHIIGFLTLLPFLFSTGCTHKTIITESPPPQEMPEKPAQQPIPEKPLQKPIPAKPPEQRIPEKPPQQRIPEKPLPQQLPEKQPESSRSKAALELSRKAVDHLEKRRPDAAIGLLERAINLDPQNGQTYFHMAQAWIMKGNQGQALEFNRMAEIRLGADPEWQTRISEQRKMIEAKSQ